METSRPRAEDRSVDQDPRVVRSKRRILDSTLEVMEDRGVAATTIEEISERSGAAKTTIYRHWPDKASLVVDALAAMIDEPKIPDTGSLRGDLAAMAGGLAAGLAGGRWSRLLPSLIEAADHDPELARLHETMADSRHRAIRSVVGRARERGEIRSDVSDDEIIELVAGPLFYRRLMMHRAPDADHARRIAELVASLVGPSHG